MKHAAWSDENGEEDRYHVAQENNQLECGLLRKLYAVQLSMNQA